jgi:hypothetical protein
MHCPSHRPWFDHVNYAWRRVQVMKLLIMQFSPSSCHFVSLRSKIVSNLFKTVAQYFVWKRKWEAEQLMEGSY